MSEVKVSLKRLWAVPLLTMAVSALAQNEADSQCEPSALFRLAIQNYETSVWFSLGRFRELEETCASGSNFASYQHGRAQLESMVGNHAAALSYMDSYLELRPNPPQDFPSPVTSVPAVEYVTERALDHRVVMVNERHHASTDRLLTMELLAPLAEQGFRYLAIEAGWNGDPVNSRGYPISHTGYYVNEVVFAELIRSAIALGYRIIAYEREDEQRNSIVTREMNPREHREWWQAKNIATRVFDVDSDAKLLVHVGYGHLWERRADAWAPMAIHLRQFTGLDPLTIDQTLLSERSRPELEHPLRIRAKELGLLDEDAVVLLDSEGESVRPDEDVDVGVFGVSTRYANGRPVWMGMDGRRRAIDFDTPECAARNCMVEARRAGFPDEVPFDRVEVVNAGRATLYLPPDEDMVVDVMGLDQSVLATRNLRVPEP